MMPQRSRKKPIEASPLRLAALRVCEAQQAVFNSVTPSHKDFLGPSAEDRERYLELFSAWHAETRALRRLLSDPDSDGSMSEQESRHRLGTISEDELDTLRWHQRLILDLGDVLAGERELDDELSDRLTTAMIRATTALREPV